VNSSASGEKTKQNTGQNAGKSQRRNLFFEVILFDLRNIPNIESIVSQSTEKAKKPRVFLVAGIIQAIL